MVVGTTDVPYTASIQSSIDSSSHIHVYAHDGCTHTHTHTRTHTHTCTHTYAYTHIRIRTHTHTELVFRVRVRVCGDLKRVQGPCVIILNHRTRFDWLFSEVSIPLSITDQGLSAIHNR